MYSALFKSAHIRDPIPILRFRLEVRHEGVMVPAVLLSAYISHLSNFDLDQYTRSTGVVCHTAGICSSA